MVTAVTVIVLNSKNVSRYADHTDECFALCNDDCHDLVSLLSRCHHVFVMSSSSAVSPASIQGVPKNGRSHILIFSSNIYILFTGSSEKYRESIHSYFNWVPTKSIRNCSFCCNFNESQDFRTCCICASEIFCLL